MGCFNSRKINEKKKVIFVIGGPGCGKGSQCVKITEEFHYEHISTGEMLREIVDKKENPKWKDLQEKMEQGGFVSSEEVLGFLKEKLASMKNNKILLDGFPRNKENLEEWNKQMTDICDIQAVIYFECSNELMKKRISGRSKSTSEKRSDDNEETISKRIEFFEKDTVPLIKNYEDNGKLIKIDASKGIDEVFEEIKTKMIEKKLNE